MPDDRAIQRLPPPVPTAARDGPGTDHERLVALLARQSRSFIEMAGRTAQFGGWLVELPSRRILWSDEVAAIYEQSPGSLYEFDETVNYYALEWRDKFMQVFDFCIRDGTPFDEELEIITGTGRRLWVRTIGQVVRDDADTIIGVLGATQDISGKRQGADQLRLLEMSVSRLNDLVLITEAADLGPSGPKLVFVNDAFARRTGYERAEALGRTPRFLQGPKTERAELDRIRAALDEHRPVRAELINYTKDGQEFWIELDMVPLTDGSGRVTHWVAVGRDVTQRKSAEDRIQHLAFFDALTQLPNRLVLMERLTRALAVCSVEDEGGALMFIDLDNFKTLNDTMGHDKGDLLLQQVALRLAASVGPSDTVARLGGDEFVVMLEKLGAEPARAAARAAASAENILLALCRPYLLSGIETHSTCSIGVTLFGSQRDGMSELLKQADLAMYQAKSSGRNAIRFFTPAMQATVSAHASLSADLRASLRDNRFLLYYQPQVDERGRMVGVEALARWQHPQRGLVDPSDFIPAAEENGLILPLGQWVLETACDQLARWARHPQTAHLDIAVNVSVRQFRHPEFVDLVVSAIQHSGIDPKRLKLELTETLLADGMEVTVAKMGKLRRMGVTMALDDFGMGYSSLAALKRIPLDQLKIDKTFVRDILSDPNDAAIARAIIAMARSLGLQVVAEGVETEAQREFLVRQDCQLFQGYLFCPPLPIAELDAWIEASGWPAATALGS